VVVGIVDSVHVESHRVFSREEDKD
jgi:hypothetical protein